MDDGREVSPQPAGEAGATKAPRDLRQEITDRMVQALGEGKIPWERSWESLEHGLPRNMATNKEYRGGNRFTLMDEQMDRGWADPRFGTMRQINDLEGKVRKGERGTPIEVWKKRDFWESRDVAVTLHNMRVRVFEEDHGVVRVGKPGDKAPTVTVKPGDLVVRHKGKELSWNDAHKLDSYVSRVYTVFNVEQTDGLKIEPLAKAQPRFDVVERGEQIKAAMQRDGLSFAEHTKFAFYSPKRDEVAVPPRGQFQDEKGYYGTLLHEIGHATGAEKRLNREGITGGHPFGSEGYAKEELRAELFSVFMAAQTGIPHDESQHTAYIQSWAEALKKDKNEIFRAAAEAGQAVDYVLGKEQDLQRAQEVQAEERSAALDAAMLSKMPRDKQEQVAVENAPAAPELDAELVSVLIERQAVRQGEHPGYNGLSDRVANTEHFLREAVRKDPQRAAKWPELLRNDPQGYSSATGSPPDVLRLLVPTQIEGELARIAKQQPERKAEEATKSHVSAIFVGKPSDGKSLVARLSDERAETAKILESRTLSPQEYDAFTSDLGKGHDWLKGKGGIEVPFGGQRVRHVVEITADRRQTLLVDPSGYDYARNVGVPEADLERTKAAGLVVGPDTADLSKQSAGIAERSDKSEPERGVTGVFVGNTLVATTRHVDLTEQGGRRDQPDQPELEQQAPPRQARRKSRGMER